MAKSQTWAEYDKLRFTSRGVTHRGVVWAGSRPEPYTVVVDGEPVRYAFVLHPFYLISLI